MTSDQDKDMRALWAVGVSIKEIAMRLGVGRGTITKSAVRLGLENRKHISPAKRARIFELRDLGKTYPQIAAEIGCGEKVVRNLLAFAAPDNASQRREWRADEVETMRAIWDTSRTWQVNAKAVSDAIGRHPQGVLHKAKQIGLIDNNLLDASVPTPQKVSQHADACLREGGFPAAYVRNGRTVWVWPTARRVAA